MTRTSSARSQERAQQGALGSRRDTSRVERVGRRATRWLTLALVLAIPLPALAGLVPTISEVNLLVLKHQTDGVLWGWTFEVEIQGVDMNVVTLTPPGKSAISLSGDASLRKLQSATYGSLAALQADFPPSGAQSYVIQFDGGVVTLTLDFAPVMPDGPGGFIAPTHNSATSDTTPTLVFGVTPCTNCVVQVVSIEDSPPSGFYLERFEFGPPFSTSVGLPDMTPTVASLTVGDYEACQSLAVGTIESDFVNGGQTFELARAGVDEDCVEFTVVPPPDVTLVEMWIGEFKVGGTAQGWLYEIYVTGQDVLAGTLTPPGGAPIDLVATSPGELFYVSSPFASLGLLQAAFPPSTTGGYLISLNGGVSTVALDFDPLLPDGAMTVSAPANGATVGSLPSFTLANACTNCVGQFASIVDTTTDGQLVLVESDSGTPFPTTLGLADFGPNQGSAGPVTGGLPEGPYFFFAAAYNDATSSESFTPPDVFEYSPGAYQSDGVDFTVPEPSLALLQVAALGVLAAFARRRGRGRTRDGA